jgi:8-oxo-dGTP pyrophosphatase MutT (NUDIX family)
MKQRLSDIAAINPWLRRAMHLSFRLTRPVTLGVRAIVLDGEDNVFLVRHTYTRGWHFPGGGVEVGESVYEAVGRELLEEGNIAIEGTPAIHGVFFNHRISRRDHVVVFVVRDFQVLGPRPPDREIAEARFFPANALPSDITGPTEKRLAEVLSEQPPATTWS